MYEAAVMLLDNDGFLNFEANDPENPHNWSLFQRSATTLCAVLVVFNVSLASGVPNGCISCLVESFAISEEAAALNTTLFLGGYCAGPLLFAPLSEFYGRKWVYRITFTAYIAATLLCAFAPNFGSFLIGRFLAGTFGSAPLTNVPGTLTDLWGTTERDIAMASFYSAVWSGPSLGSLISAFLGSAKGWRWCFFILLYLGVGSWIPMLAMSETHGSTILLQEAKRLRKVARPGFEQITTRMESPALHLSTLLWDALSRPWSLLLDFTSFVCAIYLSVVYALLFMFLSIYPIIFRDKRHWQPGLSELPMLGIVGGAFLGAIVAILRSVYRKRLARANHQAEYDCPEDRMHLAMVGSVLFPVSMFVFAWTGEYK